MAGLWRKRGHVCLLSSLGTAVLGKKVIAGWVASCACGWESERGVSRNVARKYRMDHLNGALPICTACKQKKKDREMSIQSPQLCKKCNTAKVRNWKLAHPKEWERSARKSYLKKMYGITVDQADALLLKQKGSHRTKGSCHIGDPQARTFLGRGF